MKASFVEKLRRLIDKHPISLFFLFIIGVSLAWLFFIFPSMVFIISVSILIVFSSILMYSKDSSGVTITFMVSLLTIFAIDWDSHPGYKVIFFMVYISYVVIISLLSSIKIRRRQDLILQQASAYVSVSKEELKEMIDESTEENLDVIEKSEILRFLAVRHLTVEEIQEAFPEINRIKMIFEISSEQSSKYYYTLFQIMKIKKVENINHEIEKILDMTFEIPLEPEEIIHLMSLIKSKIISSDESPVAFFKRAKKLLVKGIDLSEIKEKL